MAEQPLLAIVGATGTGKSALAIDLARRFDGEIISVDAYQVFRGMDIGTAKVGWPERQLVPHHMIDIVDPDEPMSLGVYLDLARAALESVWAKGRLAVLAGGSGQHMKALLEGWQVPKVEPNASLRRELEGLFARKGTPALVARLEALEPARLPTLDTSNSRRLVRAIEVALARQRDQETSSSLPIEAGRLKVIGLFNERSSLYQSLDARFESMLSAGLIAEVEGLRVSGFASCAPLKSAAGYSQIGAYLDGLLPLNDAIQRAKNAHHRLARKQSGWFRSNDERIQWIRADPNAKDEARRSVTAWLNA